MKHTFGTDVVGGLNVSGAAHKIAASDLTESVNGWTDESGVWRTCRGPSIRYWGYTNITALSAGRMDNEDHVVWLDGSTLYDNGTSSGTLATTSPAIKDFDDKFIIMGADDGKNYIYDGDHLREAGPWNPQLDTPLTGSNVAHVPTPATASSVSISALTRGTTTTITTSSAHGISVGQWVYLASIGGTAGLNGNIYQATTGTTGSTLVLDIDTSGANWSNYTSGGTVNLGGCGLDGTYKFYATCIVKLASGRVLEGNPRGLRTIGSANNSLEAESVTLSPTDIVTPRMSEYWSADGINDYQISGTLGTDYYPGFRIYRTKNGGADFYLMYEFYHGDTQMGAYTDGNGDYYIVAATSYANRVPKDLELGAVYTPGGTDRGPHPQSSVMAMASQRLWMNDLDNPGRLYFTSLDGIEYVPTLNYLTFPDAITAIGSAGDAVIVFSCDRMWRVTLLGGVPDVDEIKTAVGTTYGNALALTDRGLLFLRDDGLWATDGASPPIKVSRKAFSEIESPAFVTAYGDTLFLGGSETAYVLRQVEGGSFWHEHLVPYTMCDASNGVFWAADANTVWTLFTGGHVGGTVASPDLTVREEMKAVRVVLDIYGDVTPTVWVNGNRYSDYDGHTEDGTGRRLVRLPIPRLLNHVFNVRVDMSGGAALYGYWLECER
jgi:hypothetical protein